MGGQVVITLNKQERDCLRSYLFIQAREEEGGGGKRENTLRAVMVSKTHFTDCFVRLCYDTVFTADEEQTTKFCELSHFCCSFGTMTV